jgi:hypothetical protein
MRLLMPVVTLLVLTVAGCTVQRVGAPAPAPTTRTTTTTTSTTTSSTMTTTTTVPPTAAADGRNLPACADLTCEVTIQVGDVLPLGPVGDLQVLNLGADGITLVMPGGSILTFGGGDMTINDTIVISTLRLDAGAAIIRIVPV